MSYRYPDDFLKKYKIVKIEFLKSDLEEGLKSVLKNQEDSSVFVYNIYNEIIRYGSYKDVDISEFDDMKIIWFLAWQLYQHTYNRRVLYTALKLLLVRLPDPRKYPKEMLKKLKIALTDDKLPNVEIMYGKYGIYTNIKTIYFAQRSACNP
ncbi:MAG TPA: hypothetical protein EYG93_03325 [Sulfurospirillum arcachonense]|nr:hypothetical protein [Sulfurospirillum arcachonense]